MDATTVGLDDAMRELLASQEAYVLVRAAINPALARANSRREAAIKNAAALGLSRRAIAEMTGLSHTRVIQILDGHGRRAETVAELEQLKGEDLADKLVSLVYSNSLSREEMAEATGLSVDEVNRVIGEHAELLAHRRHDKALAMVKRHMPEGWTP